MNFLPIAGEHKWWDKLVSWLLVAHNPDGTIKTEILDAVVPGDIVTQQDLDLAVGGKADQAGLSALTATVATKAFQVDLDDTNDVVATKASQSDMTAAQADILTKASQAALTTTNTNVATNTTAIARTDPGSAAPTDDTYWVKSIQGTKAWGRPDYLDVADFYTGSDGVDYALAVNRAIAKKVTTRNDRAEIILPNDAKTYRTQMTVNSKTLIRGRGSATELIIDTNIPTTAGLFYVSGTLGTPASLTVDAVAGQWTVTLPTGVGAGWAIGDLIELRSQLVTMGLTYKNRDIRKVVGISGDVLTLDAPILFTFAAAASATYAKVATVKRDITFADMRFSTVDPENIRVFPIMVRNGSENIVLDAVENVNGGGGYSIYDCLNPMVKDTYTDWLPNGWWVNPAFTGNGYGIIFGGATTGGIVSNHRSRHVRHAFTTIPLSDGDTWGGPRDCTVRGGKSWQWPGAINPTSHWDTHESGYNITFDNCEALGGGSTGFQARAQRSKLLNCWSHFAGTRGFSIVDTAPYSIIQGGGSVGAAQDGAAVAGANSRIMNFTSRDNQGVGVGMSGDDVVVQGSWIVNNGTAAGSGIQWTAGARPVVMDNYIPASAIQTKAVTGLPADGLAKDNYTPGYTSDSQAYFGANAAANIINVISDAAGVRFISASTTLGPTDEHLIVSGSSGARIITLPPVANCLDWEPKTITASNVTNSVSVDPNASELLNGSSANKVFGSAWASMTIKAVNIGGTNQWVILTATGTIT